MRQRSRRTWNGAGARLSGAALLILVVAAPGCDSSINIRAPQIPTEPIPPAAPAGPTIIETRPIAGVSGVSLEAVGLVEIDLGATEALTITAPADVMPLLTSQVVNGRLVLDRNSASYQGQASDIRYDLTLTRLDELLMRGVGEIRARGVDTSRFNVALEGVGDVRAAGRADRQEVRVAGVGSYFAAGLRSRVSRVDLVSGRAQIWASERIEGYVAAGCVLEYGGDPTLDVRGPGVVTRLPLSP